MGAKNTRKQISLPQKTKKLPRLCNGKKLLKTNYPRREKKNDHIGLSRRGLTAGRCGARVRLAIPTPTYTPTYKFQEGDGAVGNHGSLQAPAAMTARGRPRGRAKNRPAVPAARRLPWAAASLPPPPPPHLGPGSRAPHHSLSSRLRASLSFVFIFTSQAGRGAEGRAADAPGQPLRSTDVRSPRQACEGRSRSQRTGVRTTRPPARVTDPARRGGRGRRGPPRHPPAAALTSARRPRPAPGPRAPGRTCPALLGLARVVGVPAEPGRLPPAHPLRVASQLRLQLLPHLLHEVKTRKK